MLELSESHFRTDILSHRYQRNANHRHGLVDQWLRLDVLLVLLSCRIVIRRWGRWNWCLESGGRWGRWAISVHVDVVVAVLGGTLGVGVLPFLGLWLGGMFSANVQHFLNLEHVSSSSKGAHVDENLGRSCHWVFDRPQCLGGSLRRILSAYFTKR